MKKYFLYACVLLLCAAAAGQSKTEVVVKEGIVKTTTSRGDSLVRSGQMAVLKDDQQPTISLNNKMVEKILQMDRQIEDERNIGTEEIRYTTAQVYSIASENKIKIGATARMPNKTGQTTNVCRVGTMSILQDVSAYDFQGNPLSYTIEKVKADEGYYHITLPEAVEPDGEFTFILILDFDQVIEDFQLLQKNEGQWVLAGHNGTPCSLDYYHVILPGGAIFVRSEPKASEISQQDGRVAVTMRNYTGPQGEGAFRVQFLWPEKDGTSLKGIPWKNAGPEAVELYKHFVQKNIQSPALWGELAIKLVGGGFYEQAWDAFDRCYNGHESALWDYTALAWQGHLHDLWNQRDLAVEKYREALDVKPAKRNMRHDQWGIILTDKWIEDRLQEPFAEQMLIPKWKKGFKERFDALPWKNAGHDALQLYNDIVFNEIIKMDTLEVQDWVRLGLKLVGAGEGYYSQAHHCFGLSQLNGAKDMYLFCALVWSGHLHDLEGDHHTAMGKYNQALKMDDDKIGRMRHDQWGIVLTKDWVRQRLEEPFSEEMLK